VRLPGHDLTRRHVAGLEARGAEPIDLHAGDRVRVVGVQDRDARDVRTLLAHRIDATEDHVVDLRGVETVAIADVLQDLRAKLEPRHLMQRAVLAALTARRAHGVVDKTFSHKLILHSRIRIIETLYAFSSAACINATNLVSPAAFNPSMTRSRSSRGLFCDS